MAELRLVEYTQTPDRAFATFKPEDITLPTGSVRLWKNKALTSSAALVKPRSNATPTARTTNKNGSSWTADAWEMYDQVGELHYVVSTLAHRISQARLTITDQDGNEITEGPAHEAFEFFRRNDIPQLLRTLAIGLLVGGDAYLAGLHPTGPANTLDDVKWVAASPEDLTISHEHFTYQNVNYPFDSNTLIRIYRPHPRAANETDSAVRGALPTLREIVGLNMYVSAQIDSRLAGAGILTIPESVDRAIQAQNGHSIDDASTFLDSLVEAMLTPISDRSSPASVVPITVTVPDDAPAMNHISFASPLDNEVRELREAAIARLALAMDIPPEVLTGTAEQNHWGAWQTQEEVVTTHLWPVLSLIATGLTEYLLHPVLEATTGVDPRQYRITFDIQPLLGKPDRGGVALQLFEAGALSAEAVLRENGFDPSDAATNPTPTHSTGTNEESAPIPGTRP